MMKTVRRRTSTGLITASTAAETDRNSSDARFLRRHNSAGWRAFTCSGSCARRDSLPSIVVTPDSIPQFTIPRLAVQDLHPRSPQDAEALPGEEPADHLRLSSSSSSVSSPSSSSSSSFSLSPGLERKARRSISDPEKHKRRCSPGAFSDQCSDPSTRGALSLPHLAKVTTPYGFVTLSQSPQMASEEELFLQAGSRSWARAKRNLPSRTPEVTDSHPVSGGISHAKETSVCSGSSPSPGAFSRRLKQSLWECLRKHLSTKKST